MIFVMIVILLASLISTHAAIVLVVVFVALAVYNEFRRYRKDRNQVS